MTPPPWLYTERLTQAFEAAARMHADQRRKGTDVPYLSHLVGTAAIALEYGADEDEAIAALLHDAIEDVEPTEEARATVAGFGDRVLRIVEACTDADRHPKPPWRQRKEAYVRSLARADASVLLVSASDKLHNARSVVADLRTMGDSLWERFTGGRDGSLWYYRALVEAFRANAAHNSALVDELDRTVTEMERLAGLGSAEPGEEPGAVAPPAGNRLARAFRRLPAPLRWLATLALSLAAFAGLYLAMDVAGRLGENVLFPRQIDASWTTQLALPPGPGDSWVGNVASDGERIYVMARQSIRGFWGLLGMWSSADGGETWSAPSLVSRHDYQDAARHALAVAPDGTLFAAFAEQGSEPATQRLHIRVSFDQGRIWSESLPVSPPRVGLIGLPVFLLTDDVRLVSYTDGETGDVLVQQIHADGGPVADPVVLGQTTRQLYSNADFHDAAISLASAQGRIVAVWVEGRNDLRAAYSSDGGVTWQPATGLEQNLYGGRPRLASNGTHILLAATDPNSGARYVRNPFIRIWQSADGGQTFERGPDVTDVVQIGWLELIWADGRWRLAYDACPGIFTCATPDRIWYTDSVNGQSWSEPVVVSAAGPLRALGLVAGDFGVATVWADGSGDHDWTFRLARRQP